ncbi:domain-containing 3 isoform X1 [Podarcis lilfordi]|uniref:Domain-containing 3 isoform X1 n=1 Tax=Podarcis lilfordi TaxID=74358 RepID=A0AA35LBH9_9SAUR|nr:domain-containing 3 isoform X1 [Podarcis lilfordi]
MAEGNGAATGPENLAASPPPLPPLRGLREKMVAAAQVLAEERRSQSGASPVPLQSPAGMKSSTRPVIDGSTLRTEERQRLARERREEREKQQAAKETQILEKEKKAKLQYEKQMEERQRRLKEQKLKEQQRRVAVEEKRKQKLEEDKERYEAVLHRTLERSQRLETRQKRWSWGGSVTDSDGKPESPIPDEGSKRSTSSANLKQAETVINKRLSSSAARLNSPSKGSTKRSSSLNRLNNKVPPNSEQPESKAPGSAVGSPAHAPKVPMRSRSTDRLKAAGSPSENVSPEMAQKSEPTKQPSSTGRRTPSPSLPGLRRSPSPANVGKRAPSPAAIRQKSHPSSPKRQWPPSPVLVSKPAPIQRPSITPNVLNVAKKQSDPVCRPKERLEDPEGQDPGPAAMLHPSSERELAAAAPKTKEDASSKTTLATTTAEEAARILAEKRRLAREQRERKDQEGAQREEEERIRKEEVAKRALEKQAQLEEALRELEDERRAGEEEPQRRAEQEEQEKMAELQLQREEAEAKAMEEAEKQRQEREQIVQRNKQERLERKKRIEEIMRRTRKAEQNDAKNDDKSNEEDEGVEEDEELGLEKQDQPEKAKYDSSLEDGPEAVCDLATLEDRSKMEPDSVFVNGDEVEEVDRKNDDGGGNSMYLTQVKEASPPAKETVVENSEISCVNEEDRSTGFLSNLNGKSTTWNFEEIIELGVHPKTTMAADKATQSLKDAAVVPASPRLAFEEESPVNSLTKPIETASEL